MTLLALAVPRSPLGSTPPRRGGVTGWLRPVGTQAFVAEAMAAASAAIAWSQQPLLRLMTVACLLA